MNANVIITRHLVNVQQSSSSSMCVFCAGDSEPHAGLPQHTGLPRLDGFRHRPESAQAPGAAMGLGIHLDCHDWSLQSHDAVHTAVREPRPGREEVDGERTPTSIRRSQHPVRK